MYLPFVDLPFYRSSVKIIELISKQTLDLTASNNRCIYYKLFLLSLFFKDRRGTLRVKNFITILIHLEFFLNEHLPFLYL